MKTLESFHHEQGMDIATPVASAPVVKTELAKRAIAPPILEWGPARLRDEEEQVERRDDTPEGLTYSA